MNPDEKIHEPKTKTKNIERHRKTLHVYQTQANSRSDLARSPAGASPAERILRKRIPEFAFGGDRFKADLQKAMELYFEQEPDLDTPSHLDEDQIPGFLEATEKRNKAEERRKAHVAEMKNLAKREKQTWQEIETLLQGRTTKVYNEATAMLDKLQQLAEFQDTQVLFRQQLHSLAEHFKGRTLLIARWKAKGWVRDPDESENE